MTAAPMMGFAQEAWLGMAWRARRPMERDRAGRADGAAAPENLTGNFGYWTDDWDGYPASRTRLLLAHRETAPPNPVVIGGDIHAFFANDLQVDFDNPSSPMVATEFVGTSVTSPGPSYDVIAASAARQSAYPLLREPQARLCQRRPRAQADDDAAARRLRCHRPAGQRLDAKNICGRKRKGRRGGSVTLTRVGSA